ncbi:MAG: sel1 repeat family protein, partial [Deltaproteobacteria bacterium]|nr:sel1 repeat family protein [Deltaproteobacteria bacterium]
MCSVRTWAGLKRTASDVSRLLLDASQGCPEAQFQAGRLYCEGQDAGQDFQEALSWYYKAARQNHPGACFAIGVMISSGQGVPQNLPVAAQWLHLAAEMAHAGGQYLLGCLYRDG